MRDDVEAPAPVVQMLPLFTEPLHQKSLSRRRVRYTVLEDTQWSTRAHRKQQKTPSQEGVFHIVLFACEVG